MHKLNSTLYRISNIKKNNNSTTLTKSHLIPSVNFHLWEPCNMRCKFCFATFQDVKNTILPKGHLPKDESIAVVRSLAEAGFEKITFVGGEPTLCPWLLDLITTAKSFGMNTGIVTNASNINENKLKEWKCVLDWIGISVDSINQETNVKMGRAIIGKKSLSKDYYYQIADLINSFGFKLKINTVVNQFNKNEDLTDFINYSETTRWKIFQVLPIQGENDKHIDSLKISNSEFEDYILRHQSLADILVPESNDKMKGSYAMVDPAGRFFENSHGKIQYSEPILAIGVAKAYEQAHPSELKFLDRGGIYKW